MGCLLISLARLVNKRELTMNPYRTNRSFEGAFPVILNVSDDGNEVSHPHACITFLSHYMTGTVGSP
jgi:hypothetical protein